MSDRYTIKEYQGIQGTVTVEEVGSVTALGPFVDLPGLRELVRLANLGAEVEEMRRLLGGTVFSPGKDEVPPGETPVSRETWRDRPGLL